MIFKFIELRQIEDKKKEKPSQGHYRTTRQQMEQDFILEINYCLVFLNFRYLDQNFKLFYY